MKIIIDIRDDIPHETAMERVMYVIQQGRVSKKGKLFCYVTTWKDGIKVYTRDYRKNDCFVVLKS
jgi:hypothetical protein